VPTNKGGGQPYRPAKISKGSQVSPQNAAQPQPRPKPPPPPPKKK
jgi:hypothetical protein